MATGALGKYVYSFKVCVFILVSLACYVVLLIRVSAIAFHLISSLLCFPLTDKETNNWNRHVYCMISTLH